MPVLFKLFQRTETAETLPNLFYEAIIDLNLNLTGKLQDEN